MSNNLGNNNKMYTSTPSRRNKSKSRSNSCHRAQYCRSTDEDDDDTSELRYKQKYHSTPKESCNNTSTTSDRNEYQSLPVDTYSSTMPELLNENELQLNIESDTEESCTSYRTPDTSFPKLNRCHPLYFEKANSNSNPSTSHANNDTDTTYTDIPLNIRKGYCPSISSAICTDNSSTICSKNKKFVMKKSSDDIFRGRAKQEYDESEEEVLVDFPPNLIPNVNKDLNCGNNETWNSNSSSCRKTAKPHLSMETYPSSSEPLKKNRRPPCNVPHIQELPQFLCSTSDSTDPSNISSYSYEKTLDPISLKYSSKDDLSAKSDSINMLSVVISTVMLLASKSQVPQNYITWTLKYLKCIKNKQGQYPPNIKKIQKMLTLPSGSGQGQQGKGQCMNCPVGKNPGKRMDLTKK